MRQEYRITALLSHASENLWSVQGLEFDVKTSGVNIGEAKTSFIREVDKLMLEEELTSLLPARRIFFEDAVFFEEHGPLLLAHMSPKAPHDAVYVQFLKRG